MKQRILGLFLGLTLITQLQGALTFDTNSQQQMAVLSALDIDPSFINDPELIEIENDYKRRYENSHFFKAMQEAYIFIPHIKELITRADVPPAILYLAMAESNFKTRAYSTKRASGMWQFMPYTGKLFGLTINNYIDERRDLIKSTKAAIAYLKQAQGVFGKWYLSALSYNCGMGRVNQAIRKAGTDDLAVLLDPKKKYLPRESRDYIRKIVALALMAQDEEFMLKTEFEYLMNRGNAYSLATVQLPSGERLSRLAQLLDVDLEILSQLNRQLKYDFVPPTHNGYDIYIPYSKLATFKERYEPKEFNQIYLVHEVAKGETLSSIGRKYKIPFGVIKDFNGLKKSNLSLKQKLIIPVEKEHGIALNSYMVKKGDTLVSIAKKHRIDVHRLKELNSLTSNEIYIGDRLIVVD